MPVPDTPQVKSADVHQTISFGDGELSLAGSRTRDAIRKPSGSVALTDCRNLIYGQGRTPSDSQNDGEGSVRPYHADWRVESSIPTDKYDMVGVTHQVTEVDGLPQWENYGLRNGYFPGEGVVALDMIGYFVATSGQYVELSFDFYRDLEYFGNPDASEFTMYVISCSDGYLSGTRNTDVAEFRIEQVGEWENRVLTLRPAQPHVSVVFASKFISGWKVGQRVKVKNVEVTPA